MDSLYVGWTILGRTKKKCRNQSVDFCKNQRKKAINDGSEKKKASCGLADTKEAESYSDWRERKGELEEVTLLCWDI